MLPSDMDSLMDRKLAELRSRVARGATSSATAPDGDPAPDLKELKRQAIETLETVLVMGESDDTRRKAAVDILNFSEKSKNESPVTEEQLGWLGRVILEAEEIRLSVEVGEK
jgi:hypothetical protein